MLSLLENLEQLPKGSHCLSFHTSLDEAADHAVSFLAGTEAGQSASYWVGDSSLLTYYNNKLMDRAPGQLGCIRVLEKEQVQFEGGKLRPVPEVLAFIGEHPEGVTAAGETLTRYWLPENIPDHLEYEAWFEDQPREESRFLCPYDLRKVPAEMVAGVLRELGEHHTHVVLSMSTEPAVRMLQLFVFANADDIPAALQETLRWAEGEGLVSTSGASRKLSLTPKGLELVRSWDQTATIDW